MTAPPLISKCSALWNSEKGTHGRLQSCLQEGGTKRSLSLGAPQCPVRHHYVEERQGRDADHRLPHSSALLPHWRSWWFLNSPLQSTDGQIPLHLWWAWLLANGTSWECLLLPMADFGLTFGFSGLRKESMLMWNVLVCHVEVWAQWWQDCRSCEGSPNPHFFL